MKFEPPCDNIAIKQQILPTFSWALFFLDCGTF